MQALFKKRKTMPMTLWLENLQDFGRLDHLGQLFTLSPISIPGRGIEGGKGCTSHYLPLVFAVWLCFGQRLILEALLQQQLGMFLHRWVWTPDFCHNKNMLPVLWSEKDDEHVQPIWTSSKTQPSPAETSWITADHRCMNK